MADNSKETTDKKDEDVAASNKALKDLKGEVGFLKQYIAVKAQVEEKKTAAENKKKDKENYEKKRLSKNIKGLEKLSGLNLGLGKQSFKKS
jgi:hypothetical protein